MLIPSSNTFFVAGCLALVVSIGIAFNLPGVGTDEVTVEFMKMALVSNKLYLLSLSCFIVMVIQKTRE